MTAWPEIPRAMLAPGVTMPRIVNGCWQLATDHRVEGPDDGASLEDLSRLARLGLTTFDCADIYTGVEERLGRFRRRWREQGHDPAALRVHTKFVPDLDSLPTITRGDVEAILDRSRARLGVERLDLVQFHWWNFSLPRWRDTALWLDMLRRGGRMSHLGVTNFDVAHLEPLLDDGLEIVSNQVQYSLLDRRPEHGMVALCRHRGLVLLTYGVLAGGFLTDRWLGRDDPATRGALANRSLVKYRLVIDEYGGWEAFQRLLRVLDAIARKHRVSIANVAVRWVLDRPAVAAVILGAANAEHGADNLRVFDFALDPDDHRALGAELAVQAGPPGDVYSVERRPGGRHGAIMKTGLNRMG